MAKYSTFGFPKVTFVVEVGPLAILPVSFPLGKEIAELVDCAIGGLGIASHIYVNIVVVITIK